ncbi:MAG: helix-turn-helix transcriptional regulator [Bacteroidales bacterium]|nr:helix-turn-helix transcriptional regulator [Bacteroidales bacterium]
MNKLFDRQTVYMLSDEEILSEICSRLKKLRQGCCLSQQEFADRARVSRETIKRIEAGSIANIGLATLLKILRAGGMLDGVADLVEEVPSSPFVDNPDERKRFSSRLRK